MDMLYAMVILAIPFVFIFLTMGILAWRKHDSSRRLEEIREEEKARQEFVRAEIERRNKE